MPRVLRHAQETAAVGTLVVPKWPSAPYWPMFFPNKGETLLGIVATMIIDKSEVVNCPGRSGVSLFKGAPNTDLLAIRPPQKLVCSVLVDDLHCIQTGICGTSVAV